jgi:ribosomal protein L44E
MDPDEAEVKRKEKNKKRRDARNLAKYGPAGKPVIDKVKRQAKNKKRRDRRNLAKYGEAGKPVIDKVEKLEEVNEKKRDARQIITQAIHAEQDANPVDDKDAKRLKRNKKKRDNRFIDKTFKNFPRTVFAKFAK